MSASPTTTYQPTMLQPDEANRWLACDRRPLIGQVAQVDAVGIVNPNLAVVRGVAIVTGAVIAVHYIEVESLAGERRFLDPGAVGRGWTDKRDSVAAYGDHLRGQRDSAAGELKQARRDQLARPGVAGRHALRTSETRVRVLDELLAGHTAAAAANLADQ